MSSEEPCDPRSAGLDRELAMMRDISQRLAEAIHRAVPSWVLAAVVARTDDVDAQAAERARLRAIEVGGIAADAALDELVALLELPIDEQRSTPLAVVRALVRFPNEVLAEAGVVPLRRDPFEQRANPEDRYGIAVGTWADLGDDVAELGMAWGAAKAFLHKRAHRRSDPGSR